jgi:hypothetical protein
MCVLDFQGTERLVLHRQKQDPDLFQPEPNSKILFQIFFNMQKIIFYLILAAIFLSSCKKESMEPETPRSEVPTEVAGKWLRGNFSMTDFWKYDGSYVGNAYTSSQAFNFSKDGFYEFYLIVKTTDYNCRTEAFTYHKGTVKFNNDQSFTVYPTQGKYRGFYSCAPNRNFNRPANTGEPTPQTYKYELEKDENGREWLVIPFQLDDGSIYKNYFKATSW